MARAALVLCLLAARAYAYSRGVNDFYGDAPRTCNVCHSGGAEPAVALRGPAQLVAGAEGDFTLSVSGGAAQVAGFCVTADDPSAVLKGASPGVRQAGTAALTHAAPLGFSSGEAAVSFKLVAPAAAGVVTLYAAGNSANGDGRTSGDKAGFAQLRVEVSAGDAPDAGVADAATEPADGGEGTPDAGPEARPDDTPVGCQSAGASWSALLGLGLSLRPGRRGRNVVPTCYTPHHRVGHEPPCNKFKES